ncbi:glycosyltransferase family 4 protein [Daejeonella sp.]|uniref:glycosyltransferase family 4 protein n=1 Tax=Daejeonella sp. TaxID=2805397 RepID=UPI003983A857
MTKPLVVGVDIRDLRIAKTGTGTYLKELCIEFKKLESPEVKFLFFDTGIGVYTGEIKILKLLEHVRLQVWKQIQLPLKAWFSRSNVLFCTDNIVPFTQIGYKTIPVIHDAFFFENPSHYNRIWLWFYKNLAIPAARKSAFVITPTEYATDRIHHYTGINKNKLITVCEGPKSFVLQETTGPHGSKVLNEFDFERGDYILHVGIMDKRKNIPALIYAFKKLKDDGYRGKLVLVGKADSVKLNSDSQAIANAIKKNELENDIVITGYLSDKDLSKVYAGALLYVFPSTNEGFGIPILEAFRHRLPVIVADNTCLPEVGGNAVLSFNPYDTEEIFQKMKLVIENEELQHEMIEKGSIRLKEFSWEKAAKQLLEIFKKAHNS